jgi:hypothetical protein
VSVGRRPLFCSPPFLPLPISHPAGHVAAAALGLGLGLDLGRAGRRPRAVRGARVGRRHGARRARVLLAKGHGGRVWGGGEGVDECLGRRRRARTRDAACARRGGACAAHWGRHPAQCNERMPRRPSRAAQARAAATAAAAHELAPTAARRPPPPAVGGHRRPPGARNDTPGGPRGVRGPEGGVESGGRQLRDGRFPQRWHSKERASRRAAPSRPPLARPEPCTELLSTPTE